MTRLINYLKQFDYAVSSRSFALFRILFALYSLGLIYQLNSFFPLYFDHVPGISKSLFPGNLTLFVWKWINILLLLGVMTRYVAAINYIIVVLMTAFFANSNISSFNDDLLRIGSFLLIFMPVSRSWSLDALGKSMTRQDTSKHTSYLYYLLSLLLSLGLLYFASGVTKAFSPMWQKGIGVWIPSVVPHYRWNTLPFFADSEWLMKGINYLVILFELSFVYLLFRKKHHGLLAVAGIGFHLGIALLFPFTYISIGPVLFYSLLIPDRFWHWCGMQIRAKQQYTVTFNPAMYTNVLVTRITGSFDLRKKFLFTESAEGFRFNKQTGWQALISLWSENILLLPAGILLRFRSIQQLCRHIAEHWLPGKLIATAPNPSATELRRFVFFIFTGLLCGIQLFYVSYHSYSTIRSYRHPQQVYLTQRADRQYFSTKPSNLARTFFGINSRGVFLDHGFKGTKTVFALSYTNKNGRETWLPVFDTMGYCRSMNRNLSWSKVSYSYLVADAFRPDTTGLKKISRIWADQNHIPLDDLYLTVYRKRYTFPAEFEKGYLDKMLGLPWDTAGKIHWKDTVFHYTSLVPDSLK